MADENAQPNVNNGFQQEPTGPSSADKLKEYLQSVNKAKEVEGLPKNFLSVFNEIRDSLKTQNKIFNLLLKTIESSKIKNKTTDTEQANENSSDEDPVDTGAEALREVKTQPVKIVDIDSKVFLNLEKMFGKLNLKSVPVEITNNTKKTTSNTPGLIPMLGSFFSKLLSTPALQAILKSGILGPLTGLVGAFSLAIGSWFSDGPFKGLMKEVGLFGINKLLPQVMSIFKNLFPKLLNGVKTTLPKFAGLLSGVLPKIAAFLGPIFRNLPGIGLIINLGSAFSRLKQGDIIGGLIDIASGIAGMFPGIGTAISFGLGVINAGRDLSGKTAEDKKSPMGVKTKEIFNNALTWIKDKAKAAFTWYFGKFERAWESITKGNYIEGVVTFASVIPGLWWMEPLYKWVSGNDKPKEEQVESAPQQPGILSKAWDWIKTTIKNKISTPILNTIRSGWESIVNGDYIDGLLQFSKFIPGTWWLHGIASWLKKDEPIVDREQTQEIQSPTNIFTELYNTIKNGVKAKLLQVIDSLKKLRFVPGFVIDKISDFLNLSDIPESSTPVKPPQTTIPEDNRQTQRVRQSVSNVTEPLVPLNTPRNTQVAVAQSTRRREPEQLIQPTNNTSVNDTTVGLNNVSNVSAPVTNIFTTTVERDIPYLERNKYRKLLTFNRSLV